MLTAELATCAKHAMPSPCREPTSTRDFPRIMRVKKLCTACGERTGGLSSGVTAVAQSTTAGSSAVRHSVLLVPLSLALETPLARPKAPILREHRVLVDRRTGMRPTPSFMAWPRPTRGCAPTRSVLTRLVCAQCAHTVATTGIDSTGAISSLQSAGSARLSGQRRVSLADRRTLHCCNAARLSACQAA